MTTPDEPNNNEEMTVTPGGPKRAKDVTVVSPGQIVQADPAGSLSVAGQSGQGVPRNADVEYVLTPGGYRHHSVVHRVEPGQFLEARGDRMFAIEGGEVVADLGPLTRGEEDVPLRPTHEELVARGLETVPGLPTGWIVDTRWNRPSAPVTYFRANWTVPPAPANRSGQTIFLFNGIENANWMIQPVLQWGDSSAGGDSNWCVASWYISSQGAAHHSGLVDVEVGDRLVGAMSLTSQQAILADTSWASPALASLNGVLYLAWTGEGNNQLNVMPSFDGGATFSEVNKYTSPQATSPAAPALCVHNGNLYIAWTGSGNNQLNVTQVNLNPDRVPTGFSPSVPLGETSPAGPALASFNNALWLVWTGEGNNYLNVMPWFDGQATFTEVDKNTSPLATSPVTPALCVHDGNLYIAWTGSGNNQLNVGLGYWDISVVTAPSFDTSPAGPALASLNGVLYLAWTGVGNNFLNVTPSFNDGAGFSDLVKFTSPETSPVAPALCVQDGNLYIAWRGSGNNQLNVAQVATGDAGNVHAFLGTGDVMSYHCEFEGIPNTGLDVRHVPELWQCSVALEAYRMQRCSDYPDVWKTSFDGIDIQTDGTNAAPHWEIYNQVTSCGQAAVVVTDGSPDGQVDLYYSANFLSGKVRLSDTSPASPALASLNGVLYLAWTGEGNNFLNVMPWFDGQATFSEVDKYPLSATSPAAPALCVQDDNLYLAWTASGNNQLNMVQVELEPGGAPTITPIVAGAIAETSPAGPTLASFGGELVLAWTGSGNNQVNVLTATYSDAFSPSLTYPSPQTSPAAPALGVQGGNLYIAWTGSGNNQLNIAQVELKKDSFVGNALFSDTSPAGPALATLNGVLYLAWTGEGNNFLNVMPYTGDTAHSDTLKYTSPETSPAAPALCVHDGNLYIAWIGSGNNQLNVAVFSTR
jgi:hypothetical protein